MFPVIPEVDGWNNIFQVKKKDYDQNVIDPTFIHQLRYDETLGGGRLTLDLWNQEIDIEPVSQPPVVRPREWFHVEWYYRDGIEDGALKVWINDELVWDLEDINTRGVDPDIQWGLALYGDRVRPGHHVMYADDHVIADHRVGSRYFGDSVPKLPFGALDPYESRLEGVLTEAIPIEERNVDKYAAHPLVSVSAEATTESFDAACLIDGDATPGSRWEANTGWQAITYELGRPATVAGLGIAWAFIDEQATAFSVETSRDGTSWSTALSMVRSAREETGFQEFVFPVPAEESSHVRIVGHFNDTGEWAQWISITEVKVRTVTDETVQPTAVVATSAQYPNVAEKTLDGNTADGSRWSAETDWREIQLTLATEVPVNAVGLAFPFGDAHQTQFDVYVSTDTISWDKIIADRLSVEGATGMMLYGSEVGTRDARYVRIVPKFTTDHYEPGRIAISEVAVYGPSQP
jgi:hypothetical protein